jgi:hypothetical protein
LQPHIPDELVDEVDARIDEDANFSSDTAPFKAKLTFLLRRYDALDEYCQTDDDEAPAPGV